MANHAWDSSTVTTVSFAQSSCPSMLFFDHTTGEIRWAEVETRVKRVPDPPGPLNRAQHALWKRSRGRVAGNALSAARYWLWRLSR